MSKEQVSSIHITTTVTLLGRDDKILTSVTTTDEGNPGVFGSDANTSSTEASIHGMAGRLGVRVATQAIAGLKELDY